MIYLLCFGASALFAQFAYKSKAKYAVFIWSAMSIAVTVILAGLRDYSIGIDVENYRTFNIYWGKASDTGTLAEYLKFYSRYEKEYLFALLVGVIAQYTGDFRLFLFICHFVIITGVYIGAYRQRKNVNPALVMLLFYLYFYSHSLNVMRQYMAMAILFAFVADIQKKRYVRYTIVVLITTLIHSTSFLGLMPMLIYMFMKNLQYFGAPKRRKRIIVIGIVGMLVLFVPMLKILMSFGLFTVFDYYINGDEKGWPFIVTAFLLVELAAVYIFRKQFRVNSPYGDFFLICSIAYILLQQLGGLMNYGKRIAGYFSFINILTIASLARCSKQIDNKIIINGGIIAFSLLYWFYFYVLQNASQTYPYVLGV